MVYSFLRRSFKTEHWVFSHISRIKIRTDITLNYIIKEAKEHINWCQKYLGPEDRMPQGIGNLIQSLSPVKFILGQ